MSTTVDEARLAKDLEADGALALELFRRRFYELALVSRFLFSLSRRLLVVVTIVAAGGLTSHFSRTKRAYLSLLFPMRMRSKAIPPRSWQSCEDKRQGTGIVIFTNETLYKKSKDNSGHFSSGRKLQRHEMDMINLNSPMMNTACANRHYTNINYV